MKKGILDLGGSTPHTPRQGSEPPAPPFRQNFAAQSFVEHEGLHGASPLPGDVWECRAVNAVDAGVADHGSDFSAWPAFKIVPHPTIAGNPHAFPTFSIPTDQSLGKEGMGAWGKGRNPFSKGFLPFPHISNLPLPLPHNAGGRS